MRKKIIAANWKMHLSLNEATGLVQSILQKIPTMNWVDSIVLIPPYIYLLEISRLIRDNKKILLGAQNLYPGVYGPFTGEVSSSMVASVGVKYVLVGHSERRNIFHETNKLLAQKVDSVLKEDLSPIFCCGESIDSRGCGDFLQAIEKQIREGLFHLSIESITNVVIAYEPVWAIGTGVTPNAEQIEEVVAHIRNIFVLRYGEEIADEISILYGGSCTEQNAKLFYNVPGIDGLLVGGASLVCDNFCDIIKNI